MGAYNKLPKQEVFIEHIPRANVYGIECYNHSSSADSATPRHWLHYINTPSCIEHVVSGPAAGRHKNVAGPMTIEPGAIENRVWTYWQWRWVCILL